MAFYKYTSFHAADGKSHNPGHGHWSQGACKRYAARHNLTEPVTVKYQVIDMSGGGRGGHDGRFIIAGGNINRVSLFSEFGREQLSHTAPVVDT
tara:strand:+ start:216 stop:497 length:282 start_codon:yes stop_codon:yes gene_type:complete